MLSINILLWPRQRSFLFGLALVVAADLTGRPARGEDPETVRVAAIQAITEFGRPVQSRARLTQLIRKAAARGAKIVVLPECAIHRYASFDLKTVWRRARRSVTRGLHGAPIEKVAEPVPDGPSTQHFLRLAQRLNIYLTLPLIEFEPRRHEFYNTLLLAGPDGQLLRHYRKLNPWPFAERGWATPGDLGLQTVDTPYGRLGLLICFDIISNRSD